VSLEDQGWGLRLCLARGVVERAVRGKNEKISDLELGVRDKTGIPYGKACRISIPFVVRFGRITEIIEFLRRVILVNILGLTIDGPLEIISTVLDTPKTEQIY